MTSLKEALIRDTLLFLQESFSKDHQFFIPPTYPKTVITKSKKIEEVKVVETPSPILFEKAPRKAALKTTPQPITLEPLPSISKERSHLPVESCKTMLKRLFPGIAFRENPPADTLVGAVNNSSFQKALAAKVLFLIAKEDPFAESVQKAISIYHTPCTLFSICLCETEEETLFLLKNMRADLVIAPSDLIQTKNFLPLLRQLPATSEHFLGASPLMIIKPIASYHSNPNQKRLLWQTLCKKLPSLSTPPSS